MESPNLPGPDLLDVSSRHFAEGESIPTDHVGKRIGGKTLSPRLARNPHPWRQPNCTSLSRTLVSPCSSQPCTASRSSTRPRLDFPNHLPSRVLPARARRRSKGPTFHRWSRVQQSRTDHRPHAASRHLRTLRPLARHEHPHRRDEARSRTTPRHPLLHHRTSSCPRSADRQLRRLISWRIRVR
jgi:hypothetical protein